MVSKVVDINKTFEFGIIWTT